ncbi:hypothetical protein TNCV_1054241 [Trichonephila clavipes]|nr:hypothetical protein TNCV_1054241 [Trichonephila clavipes]
MPPVWRCQIEAFEIHCGKGLEIRDSQGDYPGGGQELPTSLLLPPTSQEDLQVNCYLEYPYAAKTLFIYKHPCLLWDSKPGPTAQRH